MDTDELRAVTFGYTNYKGSYGTRRVVPQSIYFGSTPHHPEPQWLMRAWDLDKRAERTFAVRDITGWNPSPVPGE